MSKERTNESVLLGSGDFYVKEFTEDISDEKLNELITELKTEENKLGEISGGASIEYKPTFYTAKSDNGKVSKTIITDEDATLKLGLMTFNSNGLAKLSDTAAVSEDKTNHLRILKVGGLANMKQKCYVALFHHSDNESGDVDILIKGQNQSGFSLSFAKDKETVIDAEFKCLAQDSTGVLIRYIEHDETITEQ